MYEFWYDYVKQKYVERLTLCYMTTDNFIIYIKTDSETRFDTSNYELDRSLLKGKNKKVTGLMKVELGRKIITTFVGVRTLV